MTNGWTGRGDNGEASVAGGPSVSGGKRRGPRPRSWAPSAAAWSIAALVPVLGVSTFLGGTAMFGGAANAAPASYETAWSEPLNHESYWENLLGMDCTKYSDHNGYIPAEYDAAIIKDGSAVVKVYEDLTHTGAFTATGAINPSNGKPYEAPHSWVMKCTLPPE